MHPVCERPGKEAGRSPFCGPSDAQKTEKRGGGSGKGRLDHGPPPLATRRRWRAKVSRLYSRPRSAAPAAERERLNLMNAEVTRLRLEQGPDRRHFMSETKALRERSKELDHIQVEMGRHQEMDLFHPSPLCVISAPDVKKRAADAYTSLEQASVGARHPGKTDGRRGRDPAIHRSERDPLKGAARGECDDDERQQGNDPGSDEQTPFHRHVLASLPERHITRAA